MSDSDKPMSRDWIVGKDGVIQLIDDGGNRVANPTLPPMGVFVEGLMFDGQEITARRIKSFEPDCGWCWETGSGWMIPGHPLLMCWRPSN